jgi:uncharacterized protein (TIGR04255 family)
MRTAKFTKAPLTEVICGVEFNALDFASVHFGLYWQTIRDQFPTPPLDRPPIGEIELFSILPKLRRVWFESEDKQKLIQLQSNRFHYNWRQQERSKQYPHFHEIYPEFFKQWTAFQAWWSNSGETPLQPIRYELSYLNQIDASFGWNNARDYQKIFSWFNPTPSNLALTPNVFNANFDFLMPHTQGNLVITISQGIRPNDNASVVLLSLTASTTDPTIDITKWFDIAHQSTVEAFLDLINSEIKMEWGFKWSD